MTESIQWVEILEPETRRLLYANVVSGECSWTPPPGQRFKPKGDNQWWQLVDPRSGKTYYHNVEKDETAWKPPPNADVVELSKLQAMQAEEFGTENSQPSIENSNLVQDTRTVLVQDSGESQTDQFNSNHAQQQNAAPPPLAVSSNEQVPKPPPMPTRARQKPDYQSVAEKSPNLTEMKGDLSVHKKGFFRKKVSIHTMLSWSKSMIPKPMLTTLSKTEKKLALDMFRLIQIFMGDRVVKGRDPKKVAVDIVGLCWKHPKLRDEVFIQLCKQTTSNMNGQSCIMGWKLFIICLSFFPPGKRFYSYIEGYFARFADDPDERIQVLAEKAFVKLRRAEKMGPKKGNQAPTVDEVDNAMHAIEHPSVYGSTLEDVMDLQAESHPELPIPLVIKVLTQAVLDTGGPTTEGIFRVPGDIDAVNLLKVAVDRGEVESMTFSDPHVPASALKLWFRELHDPLIPSEFYDRCVQASRDAQASIAVIDDLPYFNRMVILYIIRFLQRVGLPENQQLSKMTYDNLSMVWAPNFLRCPSDDPMTIFNSAKQEMTFVRNLVLHLDTSEVAMI